MSQVKNGFLIASVAEAKKVLARLKTDIESDPLLKARFEQNPDEVFHERGLSIPVTQELTRERSVHIPCFLSCICTNCGPISLSVI
jgi:hypothetical protein